MLKYVLFIMSGLFVLGCSIHDLPTRTAFLPHYDKLKPIKQTQMNHFVYKAHDINMSNYTKLYIPEVSVIALADEVHPYDRELYTQISAYSTASYRKLISKKSANYALVDVAQKDTLVLEIALSLVDAKQIKEAKNLPFQANNMTHTILKGKGAYLLVEVRSKDAMSSKTLVQSMHIINSEPIKANGVLKFKQIQPALDAWLMGLFKS